jgi:nitrate reductase / nitrite oxidoreductase, alpha subunit
VTTVYDLLMAQYGVPRGLEGDYPATTTTRPPYTPAWSEKYTGMGRDVLIRFAREWARTAELTGGKCTIIIGAGVNHWYHANLMYRAGIHALMFCGCVGVNGGGLAHYVGQEKLAPMESWSAIAFGKDWVPAVALQNAPSWHYVHSDQWRYERRSPTITPFPAERPPVRGRGTPWTMQVRAVKQRLAAVLSAVQRNPLDLVKEAEAAGAADERAEIIDYVVDQLKSGELKFSVEDPDAAGELAPGLVHLARQRADGQRQGARVLPQALPGHAHNEIAEDLAEDRSRTWSGTSKAPQGKMDLVVDLNFRMDTSALYSDIVLPAATWYEKDDLNSTDMHSFIHPLSAAVPPCWESKSDWQIFQAIAKKFSELAAAFPEPVDIWWPRRWRTTRRRRSRSRTPSTGCARRRRADPRQDHAGVQDRHARLQEPLQPVHLARPAGPRERAGRSRHALRHRRLLRRGARRPGRP